jgi:hypothetical protein
VRRLLGPSRLLGPAGRLLGKTLAFLAPLALKLGVTRRVLVALIGAAAVVVLLLVLVVIGLFSV